MEHFNQDWKECSFPEWFEKFRERTLKSSVIPLTKDFINFLKDDAFIVPESVVPKFKDTEELDESVVSVNGEEKEDKFSAFYEIENAVNEAIESFDGSCFVKTNWSAPKDASWITPDGTFRCNNFHDILMLLKASTFVANDLEMAEKLNVPPVIVIRKYYNIKQQHEFRCFVIDNELVGISQRYPSLYFDAIDKERESIKKNIIEFYQAEIKLKKFSLRNFIFDVYLSPNLKVYIIDIQPLSEHSGTLLFTFDELLKLKNELEPNQLPEFRSVEKRQQVVPDTTNLWRMPFDVLHQNECFPNSGNSSLFDLVKQAYQTQMKDDESNKEARD